jgi:hypothetical protein
MAKDYLDKTIIDVINKVESEKQAENQSEVVSSDERTIYTGIKIQGAWVEFEERGFIEDKMLMTVPKEFTEMSEDIAKVKYPMEGRPEIILTDASGVTNILISNLGDPMPDDEVANSRDEMLAALCRMNPGVKPLSVGEENISDRTVAFLEFSSPAIDGKLYNLMFFYSLDGKAIMVSFNCMTKQMKYWKKPAFEMMRSLKVPEIGEENENG